MFGTAQRVGALKSSTAVVIAGAPIAFSDYVKSLGFTFDSHLSFDKHVNNLCRACYFNIRALRRMSRETAITVAYAVVSVRLDYCNALLAGMSKANLDKLQRVQNALARVVTGQHRRYHITPALVELHWLPVRARITFRVATLVYKLRETRKPSYLSELISDYVPARQLRSSFKTLLVEPFFRLKMGWRSFRYVGPVTWNNIPEDIRTIETLGSFKKHLKSFLFKRSYCC